MEIEETTTEVATMSPPHPSQDAGQGSSHDVGVRVFVGVDENLSRDGRVSRADGAGEAAVEDTSYARKIWAGEKPLETSPGVEEGNSEIMRVPGQSESKGPAGNKPQETVAFTGEGDGVEREPTVSVRPVCAKTQELAPGADIGIEVTPGQGSPHAKDPSGAEPQDEPPGTETTAGDGEEEGSAKLDGPDPSLAAVISRDKTTVIGRLFHCVTSCPRPVYLVVTSVVMATLIAAIFIWMHLNTQHAAVTVSLSSTLQPPIIGSAGTISPPLMITRPGRANHAFTARNREHANTTRLNLTSGSEGTDKAATELTWTESGSTYKPEATGLPETRSGGTGKPEATEPGTDPGSESTGKPEATKPTSAESGTESAGKPAAEAEKPTGTGSGDDIPGKPEATEPTGTNSGSESTGEPEATKPTDAGSGDKSTGKPEATKPTYTGSGNESTGKLEATKAATTDATTYKTTNAASGSGDDGVANETVVFAVPELSVMGHPLAARGASVSDGRELFLSVTFARRVKVYSMRGVPRHEFRTVDGPSGLPRMTPEDLAVDVAGHVWVVGNVQGRTWIVRYSRLGRVLGWFGIEELFFNWRGIAVDRRADNVLVTGDGYTAVQVYRPDGSLVRKFGTREIRAPLRIAVNERGSVFVSDAGSHTIFVFTRQGWLINKIGGYGTADGFLNRPQGMCIDRAGQLIVADKENRRVQVFSSRGEHVRTVRTGGLPIAVAVGPAGQLVVTNDVYGLIYIYPTY
ncbi:TRIM3 [Branchiostoma lanceolatum]|uniref:TRIM3 protein n=1 Tax=Branchiostoma lanceolatum TaxID=7740 RepID=A0A8K0E9I7_BRALA|nr:TRIM3 [Branchiostoma lanceolatum]